MLNFSYTYTLILTILTVHLFFATSRYKASLDKISHSMKTAPMSSLEKAVKWTEFVAKNGGADYLRSESRDASIWSVLGADLILGISLVFVLVGLACAVVVKNLLAVVKRVKLKSE